MFDSKEMYSAYSAQREKDKQDEADHDAKIRRERNRMLVPGFDDQYQDYSDIARRDVNRGLRSRTGGFRNNQAWLLKQLQADASGKGPGQQLVRMQAQQAADRGLAQQLAVGRSARPGQAGAAGMNAAFNGANIQSAVGGQAAMGGLQARLAAMGQYGQVAGQARQGDLSQMGLNDQREFEALRQRLALSGMQQQGNQFFAGQQNQKGLAQMQQPNWLERGVGMAMGAAQTYAPFAAKAPAPPAPDYSQHFNADGSSPYFR